MNKLEQVKLEEAKYKLFKIELNKKCEKDNTSFIKSLIGKEACDREEEMIRNIIKILESEEE